MNAYYIQSANEITPIFGVNSLEEARSFVPEKDWSRIVETSENVYMNTATGSVDFKSGWDDDADVVLVRFDAENECWVRA